MTIKPQWTLEDCCDAVDGSLLQQLQLQFPLEPRPFEVIGQALGIDESEVIQRIARLKTSGVVRQIGPILNPQTLGYQTTLVATAVAADKFNLVVDIMQSEGRVSHCYERDYKYNLWYTLAVGGDCCLEDEINRLANDLGSEITFALPALRIFKLRTFFSTRDESSRETPGDHPENGIVTTSLDLSQQDRRVINEIQQDISLTPAPYADMAAHSGVSEDTLLAHCRSLVQRGIVRRFSAAVRHESLGFNHNAIVCWSVPENQVSQIGEALTSFAQVSHCYERAINPDWPYNIFAMTHARSAAEFRDAVDQMTAATGLSAPVVLKSLRTIKKARVKYPV